MPDGQPRRRVDASHADSALGWHANMDFRRGVENTVRWYLDNRELAERAP
jgi:GDP-L-fucose synthase